MDAYCLAAPRWASGSHKGPAEVDENKGEKALMPEGVRRNWKILDCGITLAGCPERKRGIDCVMGMSATAVIGRLGKLDKWFVMRAIGKL